MLPGQLATNLQGLTNHKLQLEDLAFQPQRPLSLDRQALASSLRSARKGSAPGPSGTTSEDLRLLLDVELCTRLFGDAAEIVARGMLPLVSAVRLVARTLAKQHGPQLKAAYAPCQYVLSTRSGTECVATELHGLECHSVVN